MSKNLIIRADADTERGTGHVMRCLALTQACIAQGGMVTFITDCEATGLLDRITSLGAELVKLSHHYSAQVDAETVERVISQQPGAWTVLDGYHFDTGYQRRLREYGHPILVVDDLVHHEWYEADAILNQNVYAPELHYPCPPATNFLMGTSLDPYDRMDQIHVVHGSVFGASGSSPWSIWEHRGASLGYTIAWIKSMWWWLEMECRIL